MRDTFLSQFKVRLFAGVLASLAISLLTGCGSISGSIRSLFGSSIGGSVVPFQDANAKFSQRSAVRLSASKVSGRDQSGVCPAATATLYKLNSTGAVVKPALGSVSVQVDGSYSFPDIESVGIKATGNQVTGSYIVEIVGCNSTYSRIITGLQNQDVTFGSTLISFVLTTAKASALANASQTQIDQLVTMLGSYNDYQTAYNSLTSDANAAALFSAVTGATPSILLDASPAPLTISVPSIAHEGETLTLNMDVAQWRLDYPYAYVWELDGQIISTDANPNFTITANMQGSHVITGFYGQLSSSNAFDQSKPYGSENFTINVSNDIPAQPPIISVAGSSNINSATVSLVIDTGTALANCASFSALAITENNNVAPLSPSAYTTTCSQAPTQNLTYTLTTGTGTKVLSLWAMDASGNTSLVPSQVTVNYSQVIPQIAISTPSTTVPVPAAMTLSGSCDLTSGDVTITGNVVNAPITTSCSNGSFSQSISLSGADGAKTVTVSQTNLFGTMGSDSKVYTEDNTPPFVSISSNISNPTNQSPILVTATFSENVTGFDQTKIVIGNGTINGFTAVSPSVYNITITPTANGIVTVDIPAGSAQDVAGNLSLAATTFSRTYDTTRATVTLTSAVNGTTNLSVIPVTATFSKAVSGLSLTGIVVSGGSASGLSGSGTTYTFSVMPSGQGSVNVTLSSGAAADSAGNSNLVSNTLTFVYDSVAPTVVLTTAAANPSNSAPFSYTATFSEAVSGLTSSGLSVTNGTASAVSGSGTTYTFTVTPTAQGVVSVQVAAGAAHDLATNLSTASNTVSITYDTTAPTVILGTTSANPTNVSPIPVSATFSKSVSGLSASGITVSGGSVSGLTGSGASYAFNVTPSGNGAISIKVNASVAQDAAGNGNTASNTLGVTFNNVQPTVNITTAAANPTNLSSVPVTVTFSSAVTGFSSASLTLTNATISGFSATSASVYTFNLLPSSQGAAGASVAAGVAQDSASNLNLASNNFTITYDSVAPTVSLTTSATSPTDLASYGMTATFSEPVSGLALAGITVTNGTASALVGSGTTYTFTVTPAGQGVVSVQVAAGSAHDAATNSSAASNIVSITYDSVQPTIVLSTVTASPTNSAMFQVTATFSKSVSGFSLGSINVANGVASSLTGTGSAYTFQIAPSSQGAFSIVVPASSVTDSAGNANTVSNTLAMVYDSVAPTVNLTTTLSSPTNISPFPMTATFSEAVTGLSLAGIAVTGGTASALSGTGANYTFNVTPSGQGAVTVQLAAAAAHDAATNASTASNTVSLVYNSIAPVLAFSAPANNSYITTSNQTSLSVSGTCTETGTVQLALSTLTASASCNGSTFSTTMDTHSIADGNYALTANMTDAAGNVATPASLNVKKNTPALLTVSGFPNSVAAGSSNSLTVNVYDAYGNPAVNYTGTVQFGTTATSKTLPANYTFTSGSGQDNGAHSFGAVILNTSGTQSLTAADTVTVSLTGTESGITVSPTAAQSFVVTGYPSSTTAGTANSFTVTAKDQYGNVATGYSGSVVFTSSDGQAVLPSSAPLVQGSQSFSATLKTAGTQSITATDSVTFSLTAMQSGISVTHASADPSHTTLQASPSAVLANGTTSITLAVTLQDLYGNAVSGSGVTLASTGTGQTLTQPSGLTNGSGQISGSIVSTTIGVDTISITSPSGLTTVTAPANFVGNLGAFTIAAAYPQNGQATVVWNASTNATSYSVGYSTTSGVYTSTACSATTALSCTISGLTNGTTYYFMVTATNGVSTLPASAQANATPVSVTPTLTSPTSAAPIGAMATPLSGTTFSVSGTNFQYGAVVKVDGTPCTTTTYVSSTSLTCTIPNGATTTYVASVTVSVVNVDTVSASQTGALVYLGAPSMWLSATNGALNTSGTSATNGAAVATWTDQTGNGNTFTATSRPTFTTNVANSQPGLLFSGSQQMSMAANSLGSDVTGMTIIASEQFTTNSNASSDFIFMLNTSGSQRFKYAANNNSGDKWYIGGVRLDTDSLKNITSSIVPTTQLIGSAIINYSAGTGQLWMNGTSLNSGTLGWSSSPGPTSSTNNTGATIGLNAKMYISEILLYSTALVSSDRLTIEEYLGKKYGVSVP